MADHWVRDAAPRQFSILRWFDGDEPGTALAGHLAELPDSHVAKILAVRSGLADAPTELRTRFEEEMLIPWCRPFADRLVEVAGLPVYRAAGRLLQALG